MKLPFEILNDIFVKLHQKDKLECMLVCSHWNHIIEQGLLYDTVCLYSKNALDKLMTKLSQTPNMANKINRVLLFLYPNTEINLTPFLSSLSHLQTLYSAENQHGVISFDQDTVFPFFDHIQFISEEFKNGITHHILQSHSCFNLTYLRVCDFDHDVVSLLKNTPNLLSLSLTTHIKSFSTLDMIHKSLAHLQYLQLQSIEMENASLTDIDVTPAATLTECIFDEVETNNTTTLVNLLKYITMKYTSLTKLKFWLFSPLRLPYDDIIDLNQNGWDPLFQKLGCQLKKLSLCGRTFKQQIISLDVYNCRIEHLSINCEFDRTLYQLATSNQILYVQTLVLHTINSDSLVWLQQFRVLAKLKFDHNSLVRNGPSVSLPNIITYAPPTLKFLSIGHSILSIDPEFARVSHGIEKVSFRSIDLPHGIDVFLSRCMPNLSYLKLEYCGMVGKTLNLAKLNLLEFRFIAAFTSHLLDSKIMVLTIGDNGKRLYEINNQVNIDFIDKRLRSLYVPVKTWPLQHADTEPGFTLICNSLKNIAFY